ncbi:hypothetical protein [Desulfomonile tiedjei]|uniref:Uncharacterized protein n=1 Tax=Desulfomonile tiedjei (strain ATCC 49306 / DSM 6799 / DCB-1) TaxID=706587 RepID=I4CFA2_DESTA|nr:hypothetical protein [Desulfomonile tiedjei]AFM28243.1 hypothetical protein Desti_5664 [Desulfomonile tiedjei DSM 6799]
MDKKDFLERMLELVSEKGKKWSEIASTLEEEGYTESGNPLGPNTIRKRYGRWEEKQGRPDKASIKQETLDDEIRRAGPKRALVSPEEQPEKSGMLSAKEMFELLRESMERRDTMLSAQLQKASDKEYDPEAERQLESRLISRLETKIEETVAARICAAREQIREELEKALSSSVAAGLENHLASLLEGVEVKERSAGPGRGHKGSRMTKISATIPSEIYYEMKRLGGIFSSHLVAACELYLRARGKYPTDKD